ncbi:MAG: M18 family aminopeptidase [Fusobacteria bacterium]|nr:M18 family aminopeptidase [Fusobacteriota bacterium]
MDKNIDNAKKLLKNIYKSPNSYYTVSNIKEILNEKKFIELKFNESWKLEKGKNYYFVENDSSIFIFKVGKNCENLKNGIKIIAAHTDSPGLKIKPHHVIESSKKQYKLNVEVYGGPILNTWFDRPLSISGRVIIKNDNKLESKLVDLKKPMFIIPNLAIHLENKDKNVNPQIDLQPIFPMENTKENENMESYVLELIASNLKLKKENIVDFDLYLYEYGEGTFIGENNEYISSSRLDNLESVYGALEGFLQTDTETNTNILAFFDNEEIGSNTKEGANSSTLKYIIERIYFNFSENHDDYYIMLSNSILISADGAHAYHPNYSEKYDPINRSYLNEGVSLKYNSNKRYTTDSYTASIIKEICNKNQIKLQNYVNRSDQRGGSTLGPYLSANLMIKSVDLGVPMLAMHSIRELSGTKDYTYFIKLIKYFLDNF